MITPRRTKTNTSTNSGARSASAGSLPPNGSRVTVTTSRLATASATIRIASGTRMRTVRILRSIVADFRYGTSPLPPSRGEREQAEPVVCACALRGRSGRRRIVPVEPLAHFLAGLEERHVFLLDRDMGAGARIAARTGGPVLDREGAKTAQLDPIAARHRGDYLAQDGVDDVLDVALVEMRVLLRNPLHEL